MHVSKLLALTAGLATTAASAQVHLDAATFGTSRQGTSLRVTRIAAEGPRDPDQRPALLIVAGLEPEHQVGVDVANDLAQRDWSDAQTLLESHTLYVIPTLNPDGAAWLAGQAGPRVELGRTRAPFDADRDRRTNEDPPNDLNNDGMLTMMRVFDPPAAYGLEKLWLPEDDDPRLEHKADPAKGEVGQFALLIEGIDDDHDGAFNEDGLGGPGSGVDLNQNFPTHFPEFHESAGSRPLSEPESLALVQWMQAHRNVVGVLILGRGDSLLNKPPVGQYDQTGRIPKGLEKDDLPYNDHVAATYKNDVKLDAAPQPNYEGSLLSWTYADYGAWAFQSAVWSRTNSQKPAEKPAEQPNQPTPESAEPTKADQLQTLLDQGVPKRIAQFLVATPDERQQMAADFQNASEEERQQAMAEVRALSPELQARVMTAIQQTVSGAAGEPQSPQNTAKPQQPAQKKTHDSDDGKWLAYSDEQRDGTGFIPWTDFNHPQLGHVQIGGFVPGFRINPPPDLAPELASQQAAFAKHLLEMLPQIVVAQPTVQSLGSGVWRVSIDLQNPGYLPTSSAVGLKIRQPIAVDLGVEPQQLLSGRRIVILDRIMGSGATEHVEWLVRANPGDQLGIQVRSERFGNFDTVATLQGDQP